MKRASGFDFELDFLHEQVRGATWLEGGLARYRPLLADGLRFFLEQLSTRRLRPIFKEQERLPLSSPAEQRLVNLLHHVPALHKLGQVVSRDPRLSLSLRRQLQRLESLQPRTSLRVVQSRLRRELPGSVLAILQLEPAPLAEGSVALVQGFSWQEASRPHETSQGVLKMLKPGVEEKLSEDLTILNALGSFLDRDCERYHLHRIDYRETFETIQALLLHEVKLTEEQSHLAEAARLYASLPSASVPRLLPFSTHRLTAMQRLDGLLLGEWVKTAPPQRHALGDTLIGALVGQPFFSSHQHPLFHADPHAGNLMVLPNGTLGILDWSLTGHLAKAARIQLAQILLGALTRDKVRILEAVASLAQAQFNTGAAQKAVAGALAELSPFSLAGLDWLSRLLDGLALKAQVRFEPDLLLFRKSLLTLQGVLADVWQASPTQTARRLDGRLMELFLTQLLSELPLAPSRLPLDRRAGSHLSNFDLWTLGLAGPLSPLGVLEAARLLKATR